MGQTPEQFRENLDSLEAAGFPVPPEDEWPPLYEDLPYEAQEAMRLFYILPSKVDGMVGYTGKDLNVLELFYNIYEVPIESRKAILEILLVIINNSVQTAAAKIKQSQAKNNSTNAKKSK